MSSDEIVADVGGLRGDREQTVKPPQFRTERARQLWALREEVLASGASALDWDEIRKEVRRRRGEHEEQ